MERRTIDLPASEVTLLEDRARVVRRGTIDLARGVHRLRIDDVAPVLVDKTLDARSSAGHVRDVHVERRARVLPEDRADEVRELDRAIEALRDEHARLQSRVGRIDGALALVETAGARTLEEIAQDAAWSREESDWDARIAAIDEREAALRAERVDLVRAATDRRRELSRMETQRAALIQPSTDQRAAILLDVELDEDGRVELEVEYVTPSACWRPYHRAERIGGRLRFESDGCVWQNTGEDWSDVLVRFSTQRPSLGVEPPRLSTDLVRVQKKSALVHVEQRQEIVESTGLGRSREAEELPGIDDAGEALEIAAPSKATIVSDGRPHRIPLASFETDAETSLLCVPELVLAVIEKSVQTHQGKHPILAGPVDLIRDGGLVGRTSTLYVACGERFELGWGPDPALRVHREKDELDRDSNVLGNWHSVTSRIVDRISNLGDAVRKIELVERVPVSEIEKVKIEIDRENTTRGVTADQDGMVRFALELPAFGREEVELRYILRRHSDVAGL